MQMMTAMNNKDTGKWTKHSGDRALSPVSCPKLCWANTGIWTRSWAVSERAERYDRKATV